MPFGTEFVCSTTSPLNLHAKCSNLLLFLRDQSLAIWNPRRSGRIFVIYAHVLPEPN